MEKEREENICGGEKHQLVALSMAPTGYLTLQAVPCGALLLCGTIPNQMSQGRWLRSFFFKDFIYSLSERGREGESEGEKHQCVVASCAPPTEDPPPGVWPMT